MIIKIKPISINKCWQGRRYKTPEYTNWRIAFGLLASNSVRFSGYIEINLKFYIHNYKMADVDNFIKPTLDALVDKNIIDDDRFIKRIISEKFQIAKNIDEHIYINIKNIMD